jgi:hypothetical protein
MEASMKHIMSNIEKMYGEDKKYFGFYAGSLIASGHTDKALKVLKENINSFPDYSTGELVLGEFYFNTKKFDPAEMLFRGAIKKDRSCVKALKYLAEIEELRGNKKAQVELLAELLKYDPFDQDARTIVRLSEKDFSIPSDNGVNYEDEDDEIIDRQAAPEAAPEAVAEPVTLKEEVTFEEEIPGIVKTEPLADKDVQEAIKDEIVSIMDSSDDIDIPDIPFDKDEDIMKKHIFGDEVLNKEQSFSEDIIESLDTLTQSYVEEDVPEEKDTESNADFSDLVKTKAEETPDIEAKTVEKADEEVKIQAKIEVPVTEEKREYDENYKDDDPKIAKILNDLFMDIADYKRKMDSDAKLADENPESYDELVDLARSKFRYAASNAKREILYYSKKRKQEPKNEKYAQNLKFYREEILRLDKELVEELNMLKNEYY